MLFRKRMVSLIIVALASMLVAVAGVRAQGEQANIAPIFDGAEYDVTTDQEVHIYWVWLALNCGLVNVYLNASHDRYTLNGPSGTLSISELEAEQIWSPIIEAPPAVVGWDCPRPLAAGSIFDHNLGHLEPGQYTLTLETTLDYPVSDGLHVCTIEGQPLADTPSLFAPGTTTSTVTINVAAPD